MSGSRGSAIVLSMLLLILLSALGMYVVSAPVGSGDNFSRHHGAAVARNMARAGASAATARFPLVDPIGSPYVRRFPVGPDMTGRYSVTSRKVGGETGVDPATRFEEYDLVSVGSVVDHPDGEVRVEARIRLRPDPGRRKAHVLKWEESVPR
jgi:hypothetical protein